MWSNGVASVRREAGGGSVPRVDRKKTKTAQKTAAIRTCSKIHPVKVRQWRNRIGYPGSEKRQRELNRKRAGGGVGGCVPNGRAVNGTNPQAKHDRRRTRRAARKRSGTVKRTILGPHVGTERSTTKGPAEKNEEGSRKKAITRPCKVNRVDRVDGKDSE